MEFVEISCGGVTDNPGYIDVIFGSIEKKEKADRIRLALKEELLIVGSYSLTDGSIRFNISQDDVALDEIARVITHEIVHMIQDEAGRYPDMRDTASRRGLDTIDHQSPWEGEAYRLQERFFQSFLDDCEIV